MELKNSPSATASFFLNYLQIRLAGASSNTNAYVSAAANHTYRQYFIQL
jgi:hypothetical protein